MLLRSITIAAAGLAAATDAFLLPPGALSDDVVATKDEPTFKALPFEVAQSTEFQTVRLDCPGCDLKIKGHRGSFHLLNKPSVVDLAFTVDHAVAGDRLLVNGFELYPESDPLANPLRAAVVPAIEDVKDESRSGPKPLSMVMEPQDLGFSLMVRSVKTDEESGAELISVDLQVIEVGNRFVKGLKDIHVDLVKDKGGALMIGKVQQTESQNPEDPETQCRTMACRWRAAIASYMAQMMKPHCGGKMAGHGMPHGMPHGMHHGMHHGDGKAMPSAHKHHHDAIANGQIQYHHTHRTWARLFKQLSYSILLPILIGIVAGISVSIIGMVVGTLIVGLWRVFVRGQTFFPRRCHRHRSGSASQHKAPEQDAALAEEKSGLMTDQDVPPSYTDEEDTKPASV